MLHSPEWELMSSRSLVFVGFISMMYQYSVPREVAKKAKLRKPQTPATITREPTDTLILDRRATGMDLLQPRVPPLIQPFYALIEGCEIIRVI